MFYCPRTALAMLTPNSPIRAEPKVAATLLNTGNWPGGSYCANAARSKWFMKTCMSAVRCRSEEHTSELQSQSNLVCRLLLGQHIEGVWNPRDTAQREEIGRIVFVVEFGVCHQVPRDAGALQGR